MGISLPLPAAIPALLLLGYILYRLALPKPIPGNIPYNKKAVTNLLGDVPELFEYRAKHGDIFGLLPQRLRELNSPIMQLFVRPFARPWVVISHPAEAYDISTRRLKEFDRSYYLGELLSGLLPGHHISLMTGPEWSAHRRLVNDTMSSHFLHNVIAKLFFSETQELIELWRQKTRLAQGHAFSALHDIYAAALEITWTATFGSKTDAITAQVALLKKIQKIDLPASKDAAADYPHAPNTPAFDAVTNLANSLEIPLAMPFQPSLIHSLALRFFPSLSSSIKLKDQLIRNSLNVASERLASQTDINTTSHLTCVVDIAVQRETQMARKEGRTPVHDSRVIQDELFGLLVASYETTSTTLCWGLKFLTKHQAVQTRLRAELHATFGAVGAQPDIASIPTADLPYLDAVIHEIHRCGMTSVALSRRATQDTYVLGHFVPKDTEVFFLNNGPGMVQPGFATDDSGETKETKERTKGWTGEDAADFDPRRWLKKDDSGRDVFDPQAGPMNAFGAGPRGCFGRKWAQLELRFVLVLLLWNFELLPTPDALSGFAAVDKITHQPQKCYVRLKELVQSASSCGGVRFVLAPAPSGDLVDPPVHQRLSFDILCLAGLCLVSRAANPALNGSLSAVASSALVSVLVLCPAIFLPLFCRGDVAAALMAMDGEVVAAGSIAAGAHRGRRRRGKRDVFQGSASWISSVINLINTIVGAGVLAMPLAIAHMGIVLGVLVVIWSGIAAGFGLYLQSRCAQYLDRGSASFFALSQITYPNAAVIFDAAIAIKCFGVGVSYLIIIGDLMPGVIEGFVGGIPESEFLVDRRFWITAFMLIVIPLSFLRRLDSLKYTSVIALISIGYLVILVVYHFAKGDTMADRGPIRIIQWAGIAPALSSFPVIVFAYTCHQNMFSILNEIKDNSPFQTTSVVFASIGGAASIYILVAITGYLSFGQNIGGNIVGLYPTSVSATIGRAAIVVLVMFSYPLQVHPCRASIDAVLKWRPAPRASNGHDMSPHRFPLIPRANRGPEPMSDVRFAAITTGIIILSFITAMTVSSLEAVLSYVGSTGSTSISFILPGLFYYKISSPESAAHQQLMKEDDEVDSDALSDDGATGDDHHQSLLSGSGLLSSSGILGGNRHWRKSLLRRLSLALTVYGIVVMVVCLSMNIFFHASKDS